MTLPGSFARLVAAIDPTASLLHAWPLTGGVSAQVTAMEIERSDGRREKLVVRLHGKADRARNPRIAADEFALLAALRADGAPVPAPVYADPSGGILGSPCIVIEFIDGAPEFAPANVTDFCAQCAAALAKIHRSAAKIDLAFLPRAADRVSERLAARPVRPDDALEERRVRAALEAVWPPVQRNPDALLHGDFWPGNLLWRDGRLAAVIDWEDAALGDPLADLANARLEMLWAFGAGAMAEFTRRYQALTALDIANLPVWDLCAALKPAGKLSEWGLDPAAEQNMRGGHRAFIAQAFESLGLG